MDFSINDYMYHMKKEIDFLRKQVESRDELIESLLDQSSQNSLNKVSTHSLHSKQNSKSPEKNVNFPRDSFTKPKKKMRIIVKMYLLLMKLIISFTKTVSTVFLMRLTIQMTMKIIF